MLHEHDRDPYLPDVLYHLHQRTFDTEPKRKAIENAYPELINSSLADWTKDDNLLD
jgi:hypothetical protein